MRKIITCMSLLCASIAFAEGPTPDGTWTILNQMPADVAAQDPWVRPDRFATLVLNHTEMAARLRGAPDENVAGAWDGALFFWLPDPDGNLQCFKLVESSIMEPALQAQFPQIRTYLGQGVTDSTATVRIDFTDPSAQWYGAGGFHAQVLSSKGSWYIDPYSKGDFTFYTSHYKKDLKNQHPFTCEVEDDGLLADHEISSELPGLNRSGTIRRQYRLANACTGEYAAVFGGTVAGAQNAIVTAINRVTQVYEVEMSIRLVLVANNTSVVYTNASTDPFTNNNGSTMLGQNQTNMTTVIGSANYDIGHVFSTGGGGVAGLGVVCSSTNKARGVTGLPSPTGDAFYIDYVAHEMGHQFGGNHTFNSPNGSCAGGNRNASTAYEPGSGSTIQAYAGICSPDDLQAHSDAYFHSKSFDEILAFSNTGSGNGCAAQTATGNTAPTVNAGTDYTIPTGTPFTLTATGNDANGDALTYCWEERDLGAAVALATADNGASPLIRSINATTSPSRTIPQLATILAGATDNMEKLPALARTMNMRVTVRDNRAGNGGVNTDDMVLTVVNTGSAFAVTSQNTTVNYTGGSTQAVTWNVAGTTAGGINCANVKIDWSGDAGATWTTLLASTPNDGTENITIPNVATLAGRVRVSAVGNIFFDINNAAIRVTAAATSTPTNLSVSPNPACAGSLITLSGTVGAGETIDWYAGSCGGTVIASGTSVQVVANASTPYWARGRNLTTGTLSSGCVSVGSTVVQPPTPPFSAGVDRSNFCTTDSGDIILSASGGSGTTARWFTGACEGTLAGTGVSLTIPSPTETTTYFVHWENQCGVTACASVTVTVQQMAGDFNHDGTVDFNDYLDFVDALSLQDPSADFNSDGLIDFNDYLDFVDAFSVGGC